MEKYSIVSEIRQNIKNDYYLDYTILRNDKVCNNTKLPEKVWNLKREINPICSCGDGFGFYKTLEEIKPKKELFDSIIIKTYPNKKKGITNSKIIESHIFSY